MSKNKVTRGRPRKELKYPVAGKFTVNDLVPLNKHIECRLSIYTRIGELVKKGVLRYTGKTEPTGGVGKPLDIFESMANYRRARSVKATMKARKLAALAPVTLAPAPAAEPVTA